MARNAEYQKGYAAGRRRRRRGDDRFDLFYAAAMTGLLAGNGPWSTGGKPDRSPRDYAVTAKQIAEVMMGVKDAT